MNPESRIREYCHHLRKINFETLQYNWHTKTLFWDLPKVAVICFNEHHNEPGYSHSSRGVKWYFPLNRVLQKIGGVGHKSPKIGSCAEQRAANMMFKNHEAHSMDDLYFSTALRPKTMEPVDYCNNCRTIFPNIK